MKRYGVRPSVCPSTDPRQQTRCCRFAAEGPAGRRYRSIGAAAACECGQCHVVSVRVVAVFAVVDVSKCEISGRGVQPTGVRVNDLASFRVSTLNAGQGDLDVRVSRSRADGADEPVDVVKVGTSRLSVLLPRDAMPARVIATTLCLSVCLSQVGVRSKRMNESSWFLARELPSTRPALC